MTIGSAVRASCALPGVMPPAKLQAKDASGNIVPFEVDGLEWIDKRVQADIPFQRISTLFNVNNYIVSQVNVHVVPFLRAHFCESVWNGSRGNYCVKRQNRTRKMKHFCRLTVET